MKYLILSDTHSSKLFYDFAQNFNFSPFDAIIHCGDIYDDALYVQQLSGLDLIAVNGNCCRQYYTPFAVIEKRIDICSTPAVISHIPDDKHINSSCKIFLYGHTHAWRFSKIDGAVFFNPGHIKAPIDRTRKPSYGIISCNSNREFIFSVKEAFTNKTLLEKAVFFKL